MNEDDFMALGQAAEGYSGSDITIVVKESMMMPVRRCQTATKFKKVAGGLFEPTFPSEPEGVEMSLYTMDPKLLKAPDVTVDDVFQALSRIKPSVGAHDLDRQIEFTNEFGQDG